MKIQYVKKTCFIKSIGQIFVYFQNGVPIFFDRKNQSENEFLPIFGGQAKSNCKEIHFNFNNFNGVSVKMKNEKFIFYDFLIQN